MRFTRSTQSLMAQQHTEMSSSLFKGIQLSCVVGNIVEVSTEGIAISCDPGFGLHAGIGRTIREAGGAQFMKSIQSSKSRQDSRGDTSSMIVVAGTGNIRAKRVLLVPLRNTNRASINLVYSKIFDKAAELQLESLALPVLGTGLFAMDFADASAAMKTALISCSNFGLIRKIQFMDLNANTMQQLGHTLQQMAIDYAAAPHSPAVSSASSGSGSSSTSSGQASSSSAASGQSSASTQASSGSGGSSSTQSSAPTSSAAAASSTKASGGGGDSSPPTSDAESLEDGDEDDDVEDEEDMDEDYGFLYDSDADIDASMAPANNLGTMQVTLDVASSDDDEDSSESEMDESDGEEDEEEESSDGDGQPGPSHNPYLKPLNANWIEVPLAELKTGATPVKAKKPKKGRPKKKPRSQVLRESEPFQPCSICLSEMLTPKEDGKDGEMEEVVKLRLCGHIYHLNCIKAAFNVKEQCPLCMTWYSAAIGCQPENATMNVRVIPGTIPGFPDAKSIHEIRYHIPAGVQTEEHPRPGVPYPSTDRVAYLPNNAEGTVVLKMLQMAFKQRLTFTIGDSTTTGRKNVPIWNGIHHKTNIGGGAQGYGYPDPGYLGRVEQELAAVGIRRQMVD